MLDSPMTRAVTDLRARMSHLTEGVDYRIECRDLKTPPGSVAMAIAEAKKVPGGQIIDSEEFPAIAGDQVNIPTPPGKVGPSPLRKGSPPSTPIGRANLAPTT